MPRIYSPKDFRSIINLRQGISDFILEENLELDVKYGLELVAGEFKKKLVITGKRDEYNNPTSLTISDCAIESLYLAGSFKEVTISDSRINKINFENSTTIEKLTINNFSDPYTIEEFIGIESGRIFSLHLNRFHATLFILRGTIDSCHISLSKFENFYFQGSQTVLLKIEEQSSATELHVGLKKINNTIREILLEQVDVQDLKIQSIVGESCKILGARLNKLEVQFQSLNSFEINASENTEEAFPINPTIRDITITGWPEIKKTTFLLANIRKLDKFYAADINYFNEAFFDNFNVHEEFTLNNTALIKCKFNKIGFDCQLSLYRTFLQDSDFVNVRWPEDFRINETVDSRKQLESMREAYRQLKRVSLSQNNKIHALEFQRNEMQIHYLIIKYKALNGFKGIKDWGNFIIVGTHKWVSDFGTNIWKPLLLLFGVHLILFNFLLYYKLGVHIDLNYDPAITKKATEAYFVTLLPVHGVKMENLASGVEINIGGFIDFLMRLFSGYFIFYFIYSSRKYHQ